MQGGAKVGMILIVPPWFLKLGKRTSKCSMNLGGGFVFVLSLGVLQICLLNVSNFFKKLKEALM